jgi:hypothetical protein
MMLRISRTGLLLAALATSIASAFAQNATGDATAASGDTSAAASQKKAQVVLQQAMTALGGDAWIHRRDAEFSGRRSHFYQGKPTGDIISFWEFREFPDKFRYEFTKKRDVAQIFDGD